MALWVIALVFALSLAGAAAAPAATRYVTPTGSGSSPCTRTNPCTLAHAVAVGEAGDDVSVAPGSYPVGPDPFCEGAIKTDDLYIHGIPGTPRPRIIGSAQSCVVLELTGNAALSHVEVDGYGGGHALTVDLQARAFRVLTGGSNGTIWVQRGGLLLDSVARAGSVVDAVANYNSIPAAETSVINVTAFGRVRVNADTGDQAWLYVRNTVATGGFRVDCDGSPGAQGHLFLDHFFGESSLGGGCASIDQQANPAGSGGAGFLAADWHLAPGSPLVDAGGNEYVAPGDSAYGQDIDGGSRISGSRVDIGADEFGAPETTITSGPRRRTHRRRPTFKFTANDLAATFKCRLDAKRYRLCESPKTLRKLSFGRHTFRVRAFAAAGNPDPSPAVRRFRVVR